MSKSFIGVVNRLVITSGSGIILGSLFQVMMGRMLPLADFGLLQAVLSIQVILSAPVASVGMYVAKTASFLHAHHRFTELTAFLKRMLRNTFLVCFVGLAGWMGYATATNAFESLSFLALLFVCIHLSGSILIVIFGASFQGIHAFRLYGKHMLFTHGSRLILGGLVLFIYNNTLGAVSGLLAATLFCCVLFYKQLFSAIKVNLTQPLSQDLSEKRSNNTWTDIIAIVSGNLAFGILTQSDLLLINKIASSEQAAIYASAALIGKAFYFGPGTISHLLLPMVTSATKEGKSSLHLLVKTLAVTLAIHVIGLVVLYPIQETVLLTLFGEKFVSGIDFIVPTVIVFALLNLNLVFFNYFIAVGNKSFAVFILLLSGMSVGYCLTSGESVMDVVTALGITAVVGIFSGSCLAMRDFLCVKYPKQTASVDAS